MSLHKESGRPGHTLVELIVVIAIMGITLAVVAPHFIAHERSPDEQIQAVVMSARRTAVARAQSVAVIIGDDGRWVMEPTADGAGARLGALASRGQHVALHISPLGICLPDSKSSAVGSPAIDPLTCVLDRKPR